MKYSYEYKRMCVEMYRKGKWAETPDGIQKENFHKMIQGWSRIEESCGPDALQHKNQNKVWTAEEKYELVAKVMAGASCKGTAYAAGIDSGLLYWMYPKKVDKYVKLIDKNQHGKEDTHVRQKQPGKIQRGIQENHCHPVPIREDLRQYSERIRCFLLGAFGLDQEVFSGPVGR